MPPLSGKQRKAQLKLKRAIKRGDAEPQPEQPQKRKKKGPAADQDARRLQSQFIKLDKTFLDDTRTLAGSVVLRRPIPTDAAVLRPEWTTAPLPQPAVPKRPRWRYQMSKEELDANEQAYCRTWLAQQDAIVEQWQRTLNAPPSAEQTAPAAGLAGDRVDDSETHPMPHPPTHFERNIEVWRQFWRVTEISQILLVLLDSRCPPLHLPSSLSAHLNIPTSSSAQVGGPPSKQPKPKSPRVILVLTKVDISGPARTTSWTSFLNTNYPGVPIVPVEAYAPRSSLTEQGPSRYEPHLPGAFRERLVRTLRDVHEQLLQPPPWVTAPRPGESEERRLQRIAEWRPKVKRTIDWDGVLKAQGKLVGKAVGGAALPKGQGVEREIDGTDIDESDHASISNSGEEQTGDGPEWKEPAFLTVGVIGQPNVGKSSLLNAIFGKTRVRASRTPGKTKHFQTLFWTSDVRLVDCPGLVLPSFVPMDIQVLSGILPISRISAVPFCVHQLARLLPLEQILGLAHPSSISTAATSDGGTTPQPKSKSKFVPTNAPLVGDKRTWRAGQRPVEQPELRSSAPEWTANDIMTAYANKKGWVTAKAGRPDVHRAGNAILRLVAEGKIPWAFWPPGNVASSEDGIWLQDGLQLEMDEEEEVSDSDEVASDDTDDVDEDEGAAGQGIGRFGVLRVE